MENQKIKLYKAVAELLSEYPKEFHPHMFVMVHHWKSFQDVYVIKLKSHRVHHAKYFLNGNFELISKEEGEKWIRLVANDEMVYKKRVLRSMRVEGEVLSKILGYGC